MVLFLRLAKPLLSAEFAEFADASKRQEAQ
jgi:hypothetical protein